MNDIVFQTKKPAEVGLADRIKADLWGIGLVSSDHLPKSRQVG